MRRPHKSAFTSAHFCAQAADLVRVTSLLSTRKWSRASFLLQSRMVLTHFASKTPLVLWVLPGCLWVPPGCLLGASCLPPGCSWVLLGASWVPAGCLLGFSWVLLGCLLAAFWCLWVDIQVDRSRFFRLTFRPRFSNSSSYPRIQLEKKDGGL